VSKDATGSSARHSSGGLPDDEAASDEDDDEDDIMWRGSRPPVRFFWIVANFAAGVAGVVPSSGTYVQKPWVKLGGCC
jgi:hypothetical protein